MAERHVELAAPQTPHWAERLVRLLDDGLVVPGTRFRVGLDGIVGLFVPWVGDAASACAALSLLWVALQYRVPPVVIARMLINVVIDALVGAVPVLGDAFDLVWKANRKNLTLIERHRQKPQHKPRAGDYVVVGAVALVLLSLMALPLVLTAALVGWLTRAS